MSYFPRATKGGNKRNTKTTHPRKLARRARALARWDTVNHNPELNKDQEYLALSQRVHQNMAPRQVRATRSVAADLYGE